MTKRFAAILLGLTLVAAACSEPVDETPVAAAAPTEPAGADEPEPVPAEEDPPADEEAPTDDTGADETESETPAEDSDAGDSGAGDGDAGDSDTGESGEGEGDTAEIESANNGTTAIAGLDGQPWFLGEIPASAEAASADLEPILIGMINQEDTPLGSFPEVRSAAQTAAAFVNAELGGVDGRPIELLPCITSFSPEQSQACAQELVQAGVVALVGGIDITSNGSFPVIEQNELPMVGGIPAVLVEQRSPFAFSFSGGGAGAAAAFMHHAASNGATKVVVAYGEFEPFEVVANDYATVVGESLGLDVELLSFSLFATDYLPVLTKAQEVGADAIILLAADSACLPVMQNMTDLAIDAQLYLTGACATETIIDAAGDDILGVLFNTEGPIEPGDPEGEIYAAALDLYAAEPAGGAGTVGFRAMMNLYGLLSELGGDNISSASILDAVRATVDQPSFWGHPYTCDGRQVPGLPALCAPQQILFEVPVAAGDPTAIGDWIDTAELFQVVDG